MKPILRELINTDVRGALAAAMFYACNANAAGFVPLVSEESCTICAKATTNELIGFGEYFGICGDYYRSPFNRNIDEVEVLPEFEDLKQEIILTANMCTI